MVANKTWGELAQECQARGIPVPKNAGTADLKKLLARPKKK